MAGRVVEVWIVGWKCGQKSYIGVWIGGWKCGWNAGKRGPVGLIDDECDWLDANDVS